MLSLLCSLVLASSPPSAPPDRLEDDVEAYFYAGAHYSPPPSPYLSTLRALLLEDDNREAQMVTSCSYAPISAVYVVRDESNRAVVVSATLQYEFWAEVLVGRCVMTGQCPLAKKTSSELELMLRPKIVRKKAPLSTTSYDLIKRVWTAALQEVRPRQPPRGVDGAMYYFADFTAGAGYRTGSTWSPDRGTRLAALVCLGDLLSSYARSENEEQRSKVEAQLLREAQLLLARFSSSAPVNPSSSTR